MKFIKKFESSKSSKIFDDIKELEYILKDEGIQISDFYEDSSIDLTFHKIYVYIKCPFYKRSDFSTDRNYKNGIKKEILKGAYFSEYVDRVHDICVGEDDFYKVFIILSYDNNVDEPVFAIDKLGTRAIF